MLSTCGSPNQDHIQMSANGTISHKTSVRYIGCLNLQAKQNIQSSHNRSMQTKSAAPCRKLLLEQLPQFPYLPGYDSVSRIITVATTCQCDLLHPLYNFDNIFRAFFNVMSVTIAQKKPTGRDYEGPKGLDIRLASI